MKRIFAAFIALVCASAFGATLNPVQLLNPAGSTAGQAIVSTGASSAPGWANVTASGLVAQAANTVVANATNSTASPTAVVVTGCNGAAQALQWTNGSGFGCNSNVATSGANANITSLSGLSTPLSVAQGGTGVTSSTGSGSVVLNTSPTISGGTINNATIGITTPAAAKFTTLQATSTLTGFIGRLINVQVFTSTATYTPTTGTAAVIVDIVSGGGAGGGTAATSTGQISVGAGGQAGGRAMSYLTSGFSGVTVTIGSGGTGVSGAAGNSGGTSSFGALISVPGGAGGNIAPAVSAATIAIPLTPASNPTGGNLFNSRGALGAMGIAVSSALAVGGSGASSPFGGGGNISVNSAGAAGAGFGAGGGGSEQGASAAATAGGNGTGGICIVYEFSQ